MKTIDKRIAELEVCYARLMEQGLDLLAAKAWGQLQHLVKQRAAGL